MQLTREKSDGEDAEFTWHKERILEINTEYEEKLSSLRALQATRREEFLRKELQARLNQYHEGKRKYCPNMKVPDAYGYVCPPTFTAGEAIGSRFHGAIEYKHDGERTLRSSSGRSKGSEAKVPLPPGRVYNNSAVHH
ncbi:ubiquitin carboxyl-terminal hydrolase 8 [Spatholobus suberectus]|nr:ubiquitin carboxyl-terminal hydrolase 8 [Spatholobus suberectus]